MTVLYRGESWGSERLSELSKVIWLAEEGLKLKLITFKPELLHNSLHLRPGTTPDMYQTLNQHLLSIE